MRSSSFWFGLILGAAVGATLGMVYAPKPGHETRGQWVEGVRKMKDAAAEKSRMMMRRGKGMAEEKKGQVEEAAADVQEQMAEQS